MRFFPDIVEKIQEVIETELDPFIVKVFSRPAPWVCALVLLAVIRVVGRRLALDPALPVLNGGGTCCSVIASAGFDSPVAEESALYVYSFTAVTLA